MRRGVPLDLDRFIRQRDVRKIIWGYLGAEDREMVLCAHNQARVPQLEAKSFVTHCAHGGHTALLLWGAPHVLEGDVGMQQWAFGYAGQYGRLDMVLALRERGMQWGRGMCEWAVQYGHLDLVRAVRPMGAPCEWNTFTWRWAALIGHVASLQFLLAERVPWNEGVCYGAAEGGHVHVLQWLRKHGCPRNEQVCVEAAARWHQLSVLQWLRDNVTVWDHAAVVQWATGTRGEEDRDAVLQWLREVK